MFGPLSLRLCSLAVMAPALTETASQARVNLSPSPPESGLESRTNGRDDYIPKANGIDFFKTQPSIDSLSGKQSQNQNFFAKLASTQLTHLGNLKNLPDLFKAKHCNSDFVVNGRMNHSATTNGKMVSDVDSRGVKLSNANVTKANDKVNNGEHCNKADVTDRETNHTDGSKESSMDITNCANDTNNQTDIADSGGGSSNVSSGSVVASEPPSPAVTVDTVRRQQTLERRAGRLARRIRRLQSVQSTSHIRSQLQGFVDNQHKNLESMATSIKVPASTDIKPDVLQSEDIKNLSTAALVNLVRRLQSSQVTLRQRLQASSQSDGNSVLTLDDDTASDVEHTAGKLRSNLSHLEKCIDSDATESSSGGESCEEDDFSDTDNKYNPPIQRRAEWKWANNRACVASRWTWLQAQVSDLEYRIRQQTEIYKQIRQTKGQVVLGEQPSPEDLMSRFRPSRTGRKLSPIEAKISAIEKRNEMSPCNISSLLHNVDKQSSKLTQSLGNCYSPIQAQRPGSAKMTPPVMNGALDSSHGSQSSVESADMDFEDPLQKKARLEQNSTDSATANKNPNELSPPADSTCKAARCRPVRIYRKRKLLRTNGLHLVNRKAARLSTVKCHCYPPTSSCPLCGGRYNNKQELDPFGSTVNDRIALLEPSFHPILSFKQDIPLTVHFEALLKTGEWQNKPAQKATKSASIAVEKKKNKAKAEINNVKKSKKAAAGLLSTKFRNRGLSRSHGSSLPGTPKNSASYDDRICRTEVKKKKALRHAMSSKKPHRTSSVPNNMDRSFSTPSPSFRDTPTPPVAQSCPSSTLKAEMKAALLKRRGESAFDINNIVIPYSMAASTRVEKLQYKEILTPKWRDVTAAASEVSQTDEETIDTKPLATDAVQGSDAKPKEEETKPKEVETKQKEETKPKEEESKPKEGESKPKEVESKPKEVESKPKEVESKPKEVESKPKEVESKPKEVESKPKEVESKPKEVESKPKEVESKLKEVMSVEAGNAMATKAPEKEETAQIKIEPSSEVEPKQKTDLHASPANGLLKVSVKQEPMDIPIKEEPMNEDDETEDMCEENVIMRHLKCEIQEKKRFMNFVTVTNKRNSRRTESGTTTPDPMSPEASLNDSLFRSMSVASPTPPSTPAFGKDPSGRKRSGSMSRRASEQERLSVCEDSMSSIYNGISFEVPSVVPWQIRTFPLDETDYDDLFREKPTEPEPLVLAKPMEMLDDDGNYTTPCVPSSPVSSSSESVEEDIDDPEWTCIPQEKPGATPKVGIVLKLKR